MVSFKFIHAADLHLDSQFKGISGLSDNIRAFLRESTFASLERLTELAVRERADFMVISGDVYDAKDASLQAQLRFREALDRLGEHGIGVYVIHGNHDPLDGPRMGTSPKEHVHVFGPEFERVVAYRRQDRRPAAVIGGISYPTAKVTENTSRYFERSKDSSLFHIALLHANVDGDPAHETYSPCTRSDLNATGYHYWALGHIHKRQILQENPHTFIRAISRVAAFGKPGRRAVMPFRWMKKGTSACGSMSWIRCVGSGRSLPSTAWKAKSRSI